MAMDPGAYFENVVITFLVVISFFIIVLTFLYMVYGKEEAPATTTPKPKA